MLFRELLPAKVAVIGKPLVDQENIRNGDGLVIEVRLVLALGKMSKARFEAGHRVGQFVVLEIDPRDAHVLCVVEPAVGHVTGLESASQRLVSHLCGRSTAVRRRALASPRSLLRGELLLELRMRVDGVAALRVAGRKDLPQLALAFTGNIQKLFREFDGMLL